jgi:hypothetical protein
MQRAFNRDVINPQDGHILCVPCPAIGGFRSRVLRSRRIANSAIRKPTNILVAFIKATLLRESRIVGRNGTSARDRDPRAKIAMESKQLTLKSPKNGRTSDGLA